VQVGAVIHDYQGREQSDQESANDVQSWMTIKKTEISAQYEFLKLVS